MNKTTFSAMELYYTVYFLFGISLICCIIVWNSNLHKDPRFTTLLSLLTALTILFTSFAIIIQLYVFHAQQVVSEIKIYDEMFNDLFNNSIRYFDHNPKMNYLYNEIFKPINYNYKPPTKRYYSEEQQIIRLILQDLSALVYYLQNDKSISQTNVSEIEYKINIFIKDLVSSPIFVENYNNIKNDMMAPTLKEYIQTHFNI
jgi:hypothetical protein